MKKIFFILITLIFTIGCDNRKVEKQAVLNPKVEKGNKTKSFICEEEFIDSLNIGVRDQFKLDIKKYRNLDSIYVKIIFFEMINGKWNINQNFTFLKDGLTDCDVEIKDFNNDGLNDMTFQSSVSARGGNVIRKLFIFDKLKRELKYIKNSENFPNLRYNKDLNCLDAFRIYGGTQTAFMKIRKDTLWEFASVELFNNRITIVEKNENGIENKIKDDKFEKDNYMRFRNYNPLIECETEY